jgi:hypothetical protein
MIRGLILSIFDNTIDNNRYVAEWAQSKWLTFSSTFFMAPALYGFLNHLYLVPTVLVGASLISMNYWRHATYSYRRLVDRYYSKFAFIICFVNGIMHLQGHKQLAIGYGHAFAITYTYYLSEKCSSMQVCYGQTNQWYKYHMLFHTFTMSGQFLVIYSIIQYKRANQIC